MRVMVIGDIHGRVEALKQCLKRSKFDKKNDILIILGDVADGGYNTYEVVEELLTLSNWIYIIGNHDEWFMNHIKTGWAEEIWLKQGGKNTLESYGGKVKLSDWVSDPSDIDLSGFNFPKDHAQFFNSGRHYYIYGDMIFVHGGFNPRVAMDKQKKDILLWDRNLIVTAQKKSIYRNDKLPITKNKVWGKVFVGHTQTTNRPFNTTEPLKFNNLWMIDTGAGWNGKLTMMDVDTEEYWQSDIQEPAVRGFDV